MTASGFPQAAKQMTRLPHFQDFPDPSELRRVGFGISVGVREQEPTPLSPTDGMSASEASRFVGAQRDCASKAGEPFLSLEAAVGPVVAAWRDAFTTVNGSPEVTAAYTRWSTCMTSFGYPVADETAFFTLVDATLRPMLESGDTDTAGVTELRMAASYADCIEPIVILRDHMRTQLRSKFLADNQETISKGIAVLGATVAELSKQFPDIG